jgi:hypothetical protein
MHRNQTNNKNQSPYEEKKLDGSDQVIRVPALDSFSSSLAAGKCGTRWTRDLPLFQTKP